MYATCIHCQKALGRNESIEALPIGQRVAFDAEKGRMWVVCNHCQRWNLTPFEERWEALEQCERAFRDTRVRQSTDNIGLARLKDGTELVRIGRPLRPEFAAWRYGDEFGVRRRQMMVRGVSTGAAVVAGAIGISAAGAAFAPVLPIIGGLSYLALIRQIYREGTPFTARRVTLSDGRTIALTVAQSVRMIGMPEARDGWGLETTSPYANASDEWEMMRIPGEHAMPVLRFVLPRINQSGASSADVSSGVTLIERAGGPEQFGRWALTQRSEWVRRQTQGDSGDLSHIPVEARLAFEMATNEDVERRALEGELQELETAWREAEEVAGIADRLLVPPTVDAKLRSLRDET